LFCEALKNVLVNKGKWSVNSNIWEGDTAEASEIDSAGDDKADFVDLFIWCGHGPGGEPDDPDPHQYLWPNGGALHFVTNHSQNTHDNYCNADCDAGNITHDELSLGEGDCEFVIFNTCTFLDHRMDSSIYARIKDMCQGVHMICGFETRMNVQRDHGEFLGKLLMGERKWNGQILTPRTVRQAWYESCDEYQSGKWAVTVYHQSCENDYMPGNKDWASGKGMVSDPPPCTSSNRYQYMWDHHQCD
jgi:hypothetical protein